MNTKIGEKTAKKIKDIANMIDGIILKITPRQDDKEFIFSEMGLGGIPRMIGSLNNDINETKREFERNVGNIEKDRILSFMHAYRVIFEEAITICNLLSDRYNQGHYLEIFDKILENEAKVIQANKLLYNIIVNFHKRNNELASFFNNYKEIAEYDSINNFDSKHSKGSKIGNTIKVPLTSLQENLIKSFEDDLGGIDGIKKMPIIKRAAFLYLLKEKVPGLFPDTKVGNIDIASMKAFDKHRYNPKGRNMGNQLHNTKHLKKERAKYIDEFKTKLI